MRYRPEIDGLRAIAVVPVILFHAETGYLSGGYVGVDIFFVLSGYLITSIIYQDLENDSFSLIKFYERRARRILPALFMMMLLCIPAAWMWMLPLQKIGFSKSLIAASLFSSNILFNNESGYFDSEAGEKPLLHTWSLAVEEQYYFIFPIILLLSWRYCRQYIFWIVVTLAGLSFALSEAIGRSYPIDNYYLAPTRAWELLAGSIATLVQRTEHPRKSNLLAFLGVGLIGFSIITFDSSLRFPSMYTLVPVLGTIFIILYAHSSTYVARVLSTKVLVSIGLVSYSAYLFHQPLFAFYRIYALSETSPFIMHFLVATTFWLAVLSWNYVEQPFRNGQTLFASRSGIFLFSLAGIALFSSLGAYVYAIDGRVGRFTRSLGGDIGHTVFNKYLLREHLPCEQTSITNNSIVSEGYRRCYQAESGTPEFVLLGDSHAEHLYPGIAEAMSNKNIAYYIQAARPALDSPVFSAIFKELLGNGAQQTILISTHYFQRFAEPQKLYSELSSTIAALQQAGHSVILLGDVPRFSQDAQICAYRTRNILESPNCTISMEDFQLQKGTYNKTLSQLSEDYGVMYIQVDSLLCDDKKCSMVKGDSILYRDTNHLNLPGSRLIGRHIVEIIEERKERKERKLHADIDDLSK